MITDLPFAVRMALLFVLAVLTLRYSARGLQYGVVILLAASLFPLHQSMLWREGGLPILTMERLVLGLLFVMFLVHLKQGRIRRYPPNLIEYCMLALLMVIAVSMYVHGTYVTAGRQFEVFSLFPVLNAFAIPFACYAILRRAVSTEAQVAPFLAGVGLITLYLGLTGVAEALNQGWLVFPKYILDPREGVHFGTGRVRGPFVQASWNGLAMIMGAPVLLWLFLGRRDSSRWYWLLGIAAAGFSIPFALQRAVWLGAAAAITVTLLAWPRRGPMMFGAALSVVTIGALFLPESATNALASKFASTDPIEYRFELFEYTLSIIKDYPVAGIGFNRFQEGLASYGADPWHVSHSTMLTLFAEVGLIGLLPYLSIFVILLIKSLRLYLTIPTCRPLISGMWGLTAAYLVMSWSVEMRLVLYPHVLFFSVWAVLLETIRRQAVLLTPNSGYQRIPSSKQTARFGRYPVISRTDRVRPQLRTYGRARQR